MRRAPGFSPECHSRSHASHDLRFSTCKVTCSDVAIAIPCPMAYASVPPLCADIDASMQPSAMKEILGLPAPPVVLVRITDPCVAKPIKRNLRALAIYVQLFLCRDGGTVGTF